MSTTSSGHDSTTAPATPALQRDSRSGPQPKRFSETLRRLSRLSTTNSTDAYADVPWENYVIDPNDPRLVLAASDPIATSDWYRSLSPSEQARVGLLRIVTSLKTAWHFENILQQGLLHRALYLPQGTPEFRYIHHEVIEESQHTLMFEELIRLSDFEPRGMHFLLRHLAAWLMRVLGRHSPVVFFSMVLAGEEPLDLMQRRTLANPDLHPLVKRIMQIHVAEEARHISYARAAIRDEACRLSPLRRHTVAFFTPVALGIMVRLMAQPTHDLLRGGVPRDVITQVNRSAEGRRLLTDGVARIRKLLVDLDLVTPPARAMWRAMRIWK